ncbi:RICIN domain-containing protein [Solirubrobacter sp. CPCC 204708]|uniref:RICIN domain-containing protein n=1 Tax=Solirubrobacter deserti TaxID=2282478 RepID=A0ABT4RUV1_9ACTN|nr:RICIN domain-containing protein [Solirubrobacter deserti]MBE2320005.1 RICIN domain-containing protein [Solirubrobacter deserti]MDA0142357.1 RICIN domain-containing protein [Solirubrobacter deserti]
MKTPRTHRTLAIAVVALGAALGSGGTAAANGVAIIPKVAPKVDMAQGIYFQTAPRDSSHITTAEVWRIVPASDGYVTIRNGHWLANGEQVLDSQNTHTEPPGPADAGEGSFAGTSVFDGSESQQWKITPVPGSNTSTITNRLSPHRKLTYKGVGYSLPFELRANSGMNEFVLKPVVL